MNCGVTLFSLSHPFTSFARMWNHHKSHGSFGFARNQSRYFLGIHHCHCPNCSWMLIPTKTRQRTVKNPRSPNLPMVKPGISLTFLGFFFTSQIHLDLPMFSPRFAKFTIESGIQPPTGVQPASKSWQLSESRWAVSRRVLQMATASTQKPWRLTASPGRGDHHAGFMMNDGKIWQMMMILWCFINFVSPFWI